LQIKTANTQKLQRSQETKLAKTKEMWEVLEVTHEGTDDVKRSRKHSLIQEYELFRMQSKESIADVQK